MGTHVVGRRFLGATKCVVALMAMAEFAAAQLSAPVLCEPNSETLCLHDGRYELQATWSTGDGGSGSAQVVPMGTRDSGLFRFFDADN